MAPLFVCSSGGCLSAPAQARLCAGRQRIYAKRRAAECFDCADDSFADTAFFLAGFGVHFGREGVDDALATVIHRAERDRCTADAQCLASQA